MFIDKARTLQHAIDVWGHDIDFEPQLQPQPTAARPGSEEKLKVFQQRLERGEELYHCGDETISADWESQAAMILYAKAHSKQIRDSKRAGRESARSFEHANAVRKRLREMRA